MDIGSGSKQVCDPRCQGRLLRISETARAEPSAGNGQTCTEEHAQQKGITSMKKLLVAAALVLVTAPAFAQQTRYYDSRGNSLGTSSTTSSGQTRYYDSRGNSLGTAAPQSGGSMRHYDSRGNSLGTSTTTGNTTRFYDARGRSTGSATGPVGSGLLGSRDSTIKLLQTSSQDGSEDNIVPTSRQCSTIGVHSRPWVIRQARFHSKGRSEADINIMHPGRCGYCSQRVC